MTKDQEPTLNKISRDNIGKLMDANGHFKFLVYISIILNVSFCVVLVKFVYKKIYLYFQRLKYIHVLKTIISENTGLIDNKIGNIAILSETLTLYVKFVTDILCKKIYILKCKPDISKEILHWFNISLRISLCVMVGT